MHVWKQKYGIRNGCEGTGGGEGGGYSTALTSFTPDSTSSSETRLWPSLRSS